MPALKIYGRRWHTTTDMVPVPCIMGSIFHGAWVIIFIGLVRHYHIWASCIGDGTHYVVTSAGLMAVFVLCLAGELVLAVLGCQGTPLEISKRRLVVPILYGQTVVWLGQTFFMLYGTVVVSGLQPSCGVDPEERLTVLRVTSAMVWSTWIFSGILWLTIFVVYNAYHARSKTETWEKRLTCISWMFGCYKTMMQQVDGRSAPLTSVAQWMSGLFGHADLTPSDLVAALVLTAAAQQQRRRLQIKNALGEKLDSITEASSDNNNPDQECAGREKLDSITEASSENSNPGIQNGGMRDDGAQMYTGIDSRTLNKKTSNRGSFCSNSRQGSPRSSGDLNRRSSNGDGPRVGIATPPPSNSDVHFTPSSAYRASFDSKRKADVNHQGHMEAITERSETNSKSDARSLRHNSSSGRTPERSLPRDDSGKESERSLVHDQSGKESTQSLQRIQEGEVSAGGASQAPQKRDSMSSAVIDLLSTKSHVNASERRRSSGEEPVLGDPPSREDSLLGHMPSVNPAANTPSTEQQFEDAIATASGDGMRSAPRRSSGGADEQRTPQSSARSGDRDAGGSDEAQHGSCGTSLGEGGDPGRHQSLGSKRRSSGEEPVLGDPPSREDSLLGHMPSVNPATNTPSTEQQFKDAIANVSGDGMRSSPRRSSGGADEQRTPQSSARSGDRDAGGSDEAQRGSGGTSVGEGEDPGRHQSLGSKPQDSGSSMSRDEIRDHAEHILERMKGEDHTIPTKKDKKRRKKKKQAPEDASESETASKGEADHPKQQGTSLEIKRGIMRRLEHLDSRGNYRDGADEGDGPRSSGSEQDSRQDAAGEGGDRSPAEADYKEPSGDQERELNPYSSMAREDPEEGKPGLMDKVREKAESLGVISSANQKEETRGKDAAPKKVKAPDKDTMMVAMPVRKDGAMKRDRSSSIGPIWNDSADSSTSKEDSQAGGASRVGKENKMAAEQSPCEADSAGGMMTRFGNYLGSWVGLGSVPEDEGEKPSEKGEEAVRPRYSTQAAAAEDGRDLEDMEEGLERGDNAPSQGNDKLSDMKTVSLSQVDAPTLAEFERTASKSLDGLKPNDFRKSGHFPELHRISNQFPVVITPSEQVSEEVEELNIDLEPGDIVDDILGRRKSVAFLTLKEAADYARFACAAYAVFEYEDPDEKDGKGNPIAGHCAATCGMCKPKGDMKTYATVIREIAEVAGIDERDILYISPSNEALAHLPYMIALDKKRKAVVLALRGTMSMADIVTDAVAHPEQIDDWLPPHFAKETKKDQGRAFGHAGIVAAASAVLADLEKGGILKTLLGDKEDRREALGDKGKEGTLGEKVGAEMAKDIDTKGYKLVVTGHSLGAGAAALIALKLRDNFEDLKCWAFSPPGGLVSETLLPALREWCISVVCGKDAVPRMTTNNLARLMDEMVTALARTRHHKLRVLVGGWWRKANRPLPQHLFLDYNQIPREPRLFLESYYRSTEHRKRKERDMYPPGRIIFIRPLKQLVGRRQRAGPRRLEKGWDAVWVTPKELIAEGILISGKRSGLRRVEKGWDNVWATPKELIAEGIFVSGKMLRDHLIQSTIISALDKVIRKHPANPSPKKKDKRRRLRKKGESDPVELAEVVVDGPDQQAPI